MSKMNKRDRKKHRDLRRKRQNQRRTSAGQYGVGRTKDRKSQNLDHNNSEGDIDYGGYDTQTSQFDL